MKIIRSGLCALAITFAAVPVASAYAQDTKTVVTSGYIAGKQYTSITFTAHSNGTYTIRYNYRDGSHFTEVSNDPNAMIVMWYIVNEVGDE